MSALRILPLGFLVLSSFLFAQSFDCANVVDIPAIECQALQSIYTNAGGGTWALDGWSWDPGVAWGTSSFADQWYGVSVSGGHVTSLDLYFSNLSGNFAITQGNLDQLDYLDLGNNQLTSFSGTGMSSLRILR